MTIKQTIRALKDVAGVGGSFLLGTEGSLVSHDMPAYFDLQTLRDAGPRIVRLMEVWATERGQVDCSLRFAEGRLYLRGFDGAVLCVLLARQVQMAALRTAAQLVISRLSQYRDPHAPPQMRGGLSDSVPPAPPLLEGSDALPLGGIRQPGRASSAPAAVPRLSSAVPSRPRHVRVYRGQRYET